MFPKKEDPLNNLIESVFLGSSSKAIENSEKRGQEELNNSEVLPRDMNKNTREQFEKLGIIFGKDADDIFVYVTLPIGWKKVPTNHSMWSHLLDNQGRVRGDIFYKAAFYDRSAHMSLRNRYAYGTEPIDGWEDKDYLNKPWIGVVTDQGKVIWKTDFISKQPGFDESREVHLNWYAKRNELEKQAKNWINRNYPNWNNPLMYWDD